MMKIGFKNFRRFKDFPMIELGGCTFLVGPNNSGKSTLLKALTHIGENRKRAPFRGITDPILWDFSFAPKEGQTEHLYLGDFMSNLNDNAQEKEITFSFHSGSTDFSFVLDGSPLVEDKPSVLVPLKNISAYNSVLDIRFEWNFINEKSGNVQYTYNPKVIINWLDNKYWDDLKSWSQFVPSLDELDNYRAEIDASIAELKTLEDLQTVSEKFWAYDVNISYSDAPKRKYWLSRYLHEAKRDITDDFKSTTTYRYIETHNASHKVLLNPEDKNDYLAQTVLQYLNEIGAKQENDAHKFVTCWMREFKIGADFIIKPIYNEAYIVDIEDFDGKTKSIGYLGTGSIQLFILLLHIAMAISSGKKTTLYIEEPEQNLHPALQSKLAEMFYEVWKKTEGRVEFVVETHSEYVIRKTQVFVAEQNYKDEKELKENNPFKVYYFPGDETLPYEMMYRIDGNFSNEFGPGFFDTATQLLYKIL